jgi:hypothetical protein
MPDRLLQGCNSIARHQQLAISMSEIGPISSEHARAICEEIGDRLRYALRADYTDFTSSHVSPLQRLSRSVENVAR